ncbi:MAG TPA: hypothetical protein VMH77_02945 [Steroidobacteraceae bacterium]|nr:hypothetical protein [Steroidobacteraceae bacterium]
MGIGHISRLRQWLARRVAALWRETPRPLPAIPDVLEITLRPSPRLRWAIRLLWGLALLYAVELALTGHPAAAAAVCLLAAAGFGPGVGAGTGARTRRLVLDAGRLWLVDGGAPVPVHLDPGSFRLGSHLLLVLRCHGGVQRLLLGPDNMAAAELACLRRRLAPGSSAGTALHSVTAPGSKSSDP